MTAIEWKNKNTYYLLYVAFGNFKMICKHSSSKYSYKMHLWKEKKKKSKRVKQFAKVTEKLFQANTHLDNIYVNILK